MNLEGILVTDRRPARSWVPIVAVVIPTIVFVTIAAWFIRAFVAPPMATIPNTITLAAAPPLQLLPEPEQPNPRPAAEPATPPAVDAPTPVISLPMFASIGVAPPRLPSPALSMAPTAPTEQSDNLRPARTADADMSETGTITGPVPLPRSKPRLALALVAGPVPLPRPRPLEDNPAPQIIPVDRHGAD